MASKGKKKFNKMSLSEFHAAVQDTSGSGAGGSSGTGGGGGGGGSGTMVRMNWADEMERLDGSDEPPAEFVFDRSQLPSAPKSILAPDFDQSQVPKEPPFTAHIANVSFEADEAKLKKFFAECNILNVRLPLDERGRSRGNGFIDFADRDSLIAALQKNEQQFFNRPLRVTLESKFRQYNQDKRGGDHHRGDHHRGDRDHHRGDHHRGDQQSGALGSEDTDWRQTSKQNAEQQSPLPPKSHSFHYQHGENRPNRYQNQQGGGGGGGVGGGGERGGYQRRNYQNQQQQPWSGAGRDGDQQKQRKPYQQRRQYNNEPREPREQQ